MPPKFISEPPSEKIKGLVKKEVRSFLTTFDPPVNPDDKPIDLIPEFIQWLEKSEPKFCKVEECHMKTQFKLIAYLRDELRNNINSLLAVKKDLPKKDPKDEQEVKEKDEEVHEGPKDDVPANEDRNAEAQILQPEEG